MTPSALRHRSHSALGNWNCGKPPHLNNPRRLWELPLSVVPDRSCCLAKTKAETLNLGHRHRRSVRRYHLGEVFRKGINVLLEEEKGGTDGTQLSFVHNKGEFLHGGASASKLVLSGYRRMRQKEGNCVRAQANWMFGLCQGFDVYGAPSTRILPRSSFFPPKQGGYQASTYWGRLMLNFNLSWFGEGLGFGYLFDRNPGMGLRVSRMLLVGFLLHLFP